MIPYSGVPGGINNRVMPTTVKAPQPLGAQQPMMVTATPSDPFAQPQPTISPVNPMQTMSAPLGGGQQIPATGLIGSEQALNQGLGAISSATNVARGDIISASSPLGGFSDSGAAANKLQADLSGVNGPAAAAAAQKNLSLSPAALFQQEQGQRAIERSAAARGGLLGGNVLQELQRNAMGIAAQDYQNQFANIGAVADRGLGATGLKANLAQSLANIAENAGIQTAGLQSAIGAGRYQAGRDIAQNATQAATQISNLLNQQGANISDMARKDITTITDMIYQSGLQNKLDAQQLATILANISGGQSSQLSQGYQNLGGAQAAGVLGVGNAIQGGLEQAIQTGVLKV